MDDSIPISEHVTILKSEYERLLKAERLLIALENSGVNNWEWYDEAMSNIVD